MLLNREVEPFCYHPTMHVDSILAKHVNCSCLLHLLKGLSLTKALPQPFVTNPIYHNI